MHEKVLDQGPGLVKHMYSRQRPAYVNLALLFAGNSVHSIINVQITHSG